MALMSYLSPFTEKSSRGIKDLNLKLETLETGKYRKFTTGYKSKNIT